MTSEKSWGIGKTLERGYRITFKYETYHPQTSDNGKWLECRAKVPMYDEKKIAIQLNVTCESINSFPARSVYFRGILVINGKKGQRSWQCKG